MLLKPWFNKAIVAPHFHWRLVPGVSEEGLNKTKQPVLSEMVSISACII